MFLDLREKGETRSKHPVARLMREAICARSMGIAFGVGPSVLIPNLLQRQFTATRPDTAWVADFTYIRTWQSCFCFAVVMDLFSRQIVGRAAGPTIHRERVLNVVMVRRRRPRGTLFIESRDGVRLRSVAAILPLESP